MNVKERSYQNELLDGDDIPFADIRRNMQELDFINTWLGGHAITIKGFAKLLDNKKSITICEIGCGGGDNLAAIAKWCKQKKIQLHSIGIDIKDACIGVAKNNKHLSGIAEWIVNDYRNVTFKTKPDIIFSSLFCHHFTNKQLVGQLLWMKENSATGFFINDLQRHWLAYSSIKLLTRLFSSSYLVKNDAPLSVARGFIKEEWLQLFKNAGVQNFSISWQWAFRYLIIYTHA